MNPIGDAAAVDELAQVYRREAQNIERVFTESLRHLQNVVGNNWWEGRRAGQTLNGVNGERAVVIGRAQELRSMAAALESHAQWIRATIRELEGIERTVRQWAASHPPDPSRPGPDATWITRWPSYCSYEWRSLIRGLRSSGARL